MTSSQYRLLDCISHPEKEPKASCHGVNPESWEPVTEVILIVLPIRVSPLLKAKISENNQLPESYKIPPVAERDENHNFVARTPDSPRIVPERLFCARKSVKYKFVPSSTSVVLCILRPGLPDGNELTKL